MEWSDILIDSYNRVPEYLGSILEDLTPDDLKWQLDRDANSIGWLTWHLTRQHDAQLADLMGDEQLWARDGWAKRLKRPADGSDTGFGDTPDQVAAFDPPDNATILATRRPLPKKRSGTFARCRRQIWTGNLADRGRRLPPSGCGWSAFCKMPLSMPDRLPTSAGCCRVEVGNPTRTNINFNNLLLSLTI